MRRRGPSGATNGRLARGAGRWIPRRAAAPLLILFGVLAAAQAQAPTATIAGSVFEDVNYAGGAGRDLGCAGCAAVANVRVELFLGGVRVGAAQTTNAAGQYTFTVNQSTTYVVRAVNSSVVSTRGAGTLGVQTFRASFAAGTRATVTDRVGGENPAVADPGNVGLGGSFSATAQSITTVAVGTANLTGVDFGFNFDTIVNTNNTGQGSLRQYVTNANTMTGTDTSIFMITDGAAHPGLRAGLTNQLTAPAGGACTAGSCVARIVLASALPVLAAGTVLNGASQTTNVGDTNAGVVGTGGTVGVSASALAQFSRPEVQLSTSAGELLVTVSGAGAALQSVALDQVAASPTSALVQDCLVGMRADSTEGTALVTSFGITIQNTTGVTVRHNYVKANNSGIRAEGLPAALGVLVEENEIDKPNNGGTGHTTTFDGILFVNGGGGLTIRRNLSKNQRGGGMDFGFARGTLSAQPNVTCTENSILNNGVLNDLTSASSEPFGVVVYNVTGTSFVISRNVVSQNRGPGILVTGLPAGTASSGIRISQGPDDLERDGRLDGEWPGNTAQRREHGPERPRSQRRPHAERRGQERRRREPGDGLPDPHLGARLRHGGREDAPRLGLRGERGGAGGLRGRDRGALRRERRREPDRADHDGRGKPERRRGRRANDRRHDHDRDDGELHRDARRSGGRDDHGRRSTTVTGTAADASGNTSEPGPNQPVSGVDFGDAPDSYRTSVAAGGPLHGGASTTLRVGASLSIEDDGQTDGRHPRRHGRHVDDGVALFLLGTASTSYAISVSVLNASGRTRSPRCAWVDFNRNGTFAPAEGRVVAVPTGTNGPVVVTWSGLSEIVAGPSSRSGCASRPTRTSRAAGPP